jgi:hypothetical protein
VAISYTVDRLIDSVRRRGQLPRSGGTMTTDDIVELMNEELQTYVSAFLIGLHDEYLVADYSLSVTGGVYEYPYPPRAMGALRDVLILRDGEYVQLQRVEPQRISYPPAASSPPAACYFLGSKIGFSPCGDATVHLRYFKRPGKLCLEEDAARITAINTGTNVVTVSALPDDFVSGLAYDFIADQPQFDTLAMDKTGTVSGSTIAFSSLPAGWLSVTG